MQIAYLTSQNINLLTVGTSWQIYRVGLLQTLNCATALIELTNDLDGVLKLQGHFLNARPFYVIHESRIFVFV